MTRAAHRWDSSLLHFPRQVVGVQCRADLPLLLNGLADLEVRSYRTRVLRKRASPTTVLRRRHGHWPRYLLKGPVLAGRSHWRINCVGQAHLGDHFASCDPFSNIWRYTVSVCCSSRFLLTLAAVAGSVGIAEPGCCAGRLIGFHESQVGALPKDAGGPC